VTASQAILSDYTDMRGKCLEMQTEMREQKAYGEISCKKQSKAIEDDM